MNTTPRRDHTGPYRRLAALMAVMALLAVGCGRSGNTIAPTSSIGASSSATSTTSAPTSAHGPSAADQLADFLTRAQRMAGQLRDAAALINTGIGTETMTFTTDIMDAIKAIDPRTLIKTIPAGMPAKLQNQVYLVFSELASRRYAFNPILETEPGRPVARDGQNGQRVLEGLSHGAGPAARFAADLAATRTLARSEPAITAAAPGSRASAEVAVRTTYIVVRNSGCGTSGGWIQTTAVPLVWKPGDNGDRRRVDGAIGGIPFRADYQPRDGWRVQLNAC